MRSRAWWPDSQEVRSRRTGPRGRLRLLSRPRPRADRSRVFMDRSEDLRVADDGRADPPSRRVRRRARSRPAAAGWSSISSAARLGGDIQAKPFQFQIPAGAKKTRVLVQPALATCWAGNCRSSRSPISPGKPWSSRSLAGKAAVIHFWRNDAHGGGSDGSRDRAVARQVQGQRQGGRAGRDPRPSGHASQDDRGCGEAVALDACRCCATTARRPASSWRSSGRRPRCSSTPRGCSRIATRCRSRGRGGSAPQAGKASGRRGPRQTGA